MIREYKDNNRRSGKRSFSSPMNANNSSQKIAVIVIIAVLLALALIAGIVFLISASKEHSIQIKEITISSTPDKMRYFVGEPANYDGLRVLVTQNNGDSYIVRASKCEITGFDSSAATESQTITVSYEGHTATFQIAVKETPKPTPVLIGISLESLPNKLSYKLGDRLITDGGVILREYKDGTVARVNLTNSNVFGYSEITAPGTYELTVLYEEGGINATTTYTITVTE